MYNRGCERTNSDRSTYVHQRQYVERGSRHRGTQRTPYQKYSGDEKINRNRERSNSPYKVHSKTWNRWSHTGRCFSSSDCSSPERKKRRFIEDDEDKYRHRPEAEDKPYRHTPEIFSHSPVCKEVRHSLQQEKLEYKKIVKGSRTKHHNQDFTYRVPHDSPTYKCKSGYYDRDGQRRSCDQPTEKISSPDRSTKSYIKSREKSSSASTDHKDHHHAQMKFISDRPTEQGLEPNITHQSTVAHGMRSTKGFQRFLEVLNKGVNVNTLTKIVTEAPARASKDSCSPAPLQSTNGKPWCPNTEIQAWNGSQDEDNRSSSPNSSFLSDDKSVHGQDSKYFIPNSSFKMPSDPGKTAGNPEDVGKNKEIQDVLQAIGLDLGFEELGKMSCRIQERLYGKKRNKCTQQCTRNQEERHSFSPRRQRRSSSSSSSGSSFNPLAQDCNVKENNHAEMPLAQDYEASEFKSTSSPQDSQMCEKQENTVFFQTFSPAAFPNAPTVSNYSPVSNTSMPYPQFAHSLPQVEPRLLLPPLLPYPYVPPLNAFPSVLAQTGHVLPQHIATPQCSLPCLTPSQHPIPPQKSKLTRPRCLQVIKTEQPV